MKKNYKINKKTSNETFLIKIIRIFQLSMIRVFSVFFKKDNNLWIFGSGAGKSFTGNSMYLYKYILDNHRNIKCVWVSKNKSALKEVKNLGGIACKMYSIKAFWYTLKAKVYVYSIWLTSDIGIFDDKRTVFVNVWHGMTIKKIVFDDQTRPISKSIHNKINVFVMQKILRYKEEERLPDIICSTSEYTKKFLASAFQSDNVFITGQPRDDFIHELLNRDFINNIKQDSKQKLILYMPTHRLYGKKNTKSIFENLQFVEELSAFCRLNNCIFAIKYHPNESKDKESIKNDFIIDISNSRHTTEELLSEADILVTDYSSCFIDFALTKRPVVFYAYDYEEYSKRDMGLYIDYNKDLPGPIVHDEKHLLDQLSRYIIDSNIYLAEYGMELEKYHKYRDNQNSNRIYELVLEKIRDNRNLNLSKK